MRCGYVRYVLGFMVVYAYPRCDFWPLDSRIRCEFRGYMCIAPVLAVGSRIQCGSRIPCVAGNRGWFMTVWAMEQNKLTAQRGYSPRYGGKGEGKDE